MLPRRRTNWWRLGWLLSVLLVGGWIISLLAVWFWSERDDARPAAAIVVLGAAQYVGRPSPVLRERLNHAIELWRRDMAPRIIFTGGVGDHDTMSEAAVSQRYAIEHGVPAGAISIENTGRSTAASLEEVARLMNATPARDVILVSDPFHMLRLSILARRYGLRPLTSPTRTSPIALNRREQWKYVLSESVKAPIAFLLQRREQPSASRH